MGIAKTGLEAGREAAEAIAAGKLKRKRLRKEMTAVEHVDKAFHRLQIEDGGVYSLVEWAKRSSNALTDFYRLWSRRIPSEVAGAGGGPIYIQFKKFREAVVDAGQAERRALPGETSEGGQAALAPE